MSERLAEKVVGIPGLRDDVKPGVDEQADDPLAHQHVVFAHHHTHRHRRVLTVLACC